MNKQELEKTLKYHDDLYYNQDNPEISDLEYDSLKNKYIELYGEYEYVPGIASSDFDKYEHTTNVSSLSKIQITDQDKLRAEIERLWPIDIEPKMDGLTIVKYPDNNFVTRGNGSVGEIVNSNMSKVDGIGTEIRIIFPIRMEVVMLISEFNRINEERERAGLEPFKNPRNAAAGMIRNKDASKVQGLKAFAYNCIFEEESEENANPNAQLNSLRSFGWNTVDNYIPETIDEAINFINSIDGFNRSELDYEIDGLVIKHIGEKVFGETAHHPLNAAAIKFEAEGEWTRLNAIHFQVGRTGKIVPVAELEPVDILGSTITRATLHNMGIVKALGLNKTGAIYEVKVIKANDVIPAIVDVRIVEQTNEIGTIDTTITECPVCGGEVKEINEQHFCMNPNCEAKTLYRLTHLAQKEAFNIEGLSEETAKKLIEKYKDNLDTTVAQMMNAEEVGEFVSDEDYDGIESMKKNIHPSFIYGLKFKDILDLDGFGERSARKLYDNIQNSKKIKFNQFLYGCGIPLVGRRAAKDIAEFYYKEGSSEIMEFSKDYNDNKFENLYNLDGIGPETVKSILCNYDEMIMPFGEYTFEFEDIVPKAKAKNQMIFVITGKFDISRSEIKNMIENAGHKVAGSVSSKTDFLIASPGEESTSKYKKAVELEKTIIKTIADLEEVL